MIFLFASKTLLISTRRAANMPTWLLWLACARLLCCAPLHAQVATNPPPALQKKLWFTVGERLVYTVYWGFLRVGEAHAWTEWIEEDGRTLLAIRAATRTVSFMDAIFPVDDFLESVVDPETFLPLRFTKRLSEGRYRLHEITTFNHAARVAHWKHLLRKDSEHDFTIEADTRDLLSFMFFMRQHAWQPESEMYFKVMSDEKLYDLTLRTRKYEVVELPELGKVRSLLIEPEAKFHGLFVRVGKLFVWISDDRRRLCTKATAKAPVIGTIQILLQRVEEPGQRPDTPLATIEEKQNDV